MSEPIQNLNSSTKRKPGPQAKPKVTIEAFEALEDQVRRLEGALRHIGSLNGTTNKVFEKYGLTGMTPKEQGWEPKHG